MEIQLFYLQINRIEYEHIKPKGYQLKTEKVKRNKNESEM